MTELRYPRFLLPILILLVPINIYIAKGCVAEIQWPLFRYQISAGSESLVSWSENLYYGIIGYIAGQGGFEFIFWTLPVLLIFSYFVLTVWAVLVGDGVLLKRGALLLVPIGVLFLVADITRYGSSLYGTGGMYIPIAIFLFFAFGIWGFCYGFGLLGKDGTLVRIDRAKRTNFLSRLASFFQVSEKREIVCLVLISISIKVIAFFSGLLPNLPLDVALGSTKLYYWYATTPSFWQIPYSNYYVPYPQFFFIPVFVAFIPVLIITGYSVYLYSFSTLMVIFDAANIVLVYSIAKNLWGRDKAFLCGILSATALSSAFFVPIAYDAFPSFLLLLSLWMYLNRSQLTGYLLATAGMLAKWYPFLAIPFYLLHGWKTGKTIRDFSRPLILSGILILITVTPFLILNISGFLQTYTSHFDRSVEINSAISYLDAVSNFLMGIKPFQSLSFFLIIAAELALLYWYFRSPGSRIQVLAGCIFLSIFIFVLFNKVFSTNYIIWLTPFLALFLFRTPRHILLYYLVQMIMYLETPLLMGVVYASFNLGLSAMTSYDVLVNDFPSIPFLFYTLKFAVLAIVFVIVFFDIKRESCVMGLPGTSEEE